MFNDPKRVLNVGCYLVFIQIMIVINYYGAVAKDLNLTDVPGPYRFKNFCMTSKNELWTGGGDGKVNYFKVDTDENTVYDLENKNLFNGDFYGIFFNDNESGWVVGDKGVIFHTTDNGRNWVLQKSRLKSDINLNAITCINKKCWTVGDSGTLLLTNNEGKKWQKTNFKTKEDLKDLFFIDEKTGWIVGSEGGIWKTVDSGNTWSFQELTINGRFAHNLSIKFHDEKKGWISGFDFVARTEDGGKTWQTTELDGEIIGIVTQDGEKVWAIKRGGNFCSTDSGKTWTKCKQEKLNG